MRAIALIPVLAVTILAAGAGAANPRACPVMSDGPGSLHRGGTVGAACMLAAFQANCRPAAYSVSSFGVDTARTETFHTLRHGSGCNVYVTQTFRVVPQQPRVLWHAVCTRLRKTPAGDVVADRCTPKRTISLTKIAG